MDSPVLALASSRTVFCCGPGTSGETRRPVCLLSGVSGLVLYYCFPSAEKSDAGLPCFCAGGVSAETPLRHGPEAWAGIALWGSPPGTRRRISSKSVRRRGRRRL
ncbi:hypothetical protein IMZ48_17920 [Candidatus Bathyarchaeota archaeon]|nr:hypothetical protein [Candidatus Bathyarchaeota archaeon]